MLLENKQTHCECVDTRSRLTFTVCRGVGLRSPSERSLQMVVLLGQLLQSFLQPHPLVPLCLEGLLPPLAVSLSQRQEVSAGLTGGQQQHPEAFSQVSSIRNSLAV